MDIKIFCINTDYNTTVLHVCEIKDAIEGADVSE